MIDENLLPILRCPISGQPLEIAEKTKIEQINEAIERGEIRDRQDQRVTEPIDGALVTPDGKHAYPIRNGIPTLVGEERMTVNS